ncbi:hypothetical protein D3C76_1257820 [compost metagenome]
MRVHRAGLVGRLHTCAGIDEQFVLKAVAQFFQAVTHRGLADAKPLGYIGYVVLLEHGNEHHEVLHIELSEQITVQHPFCLAVLLAQNVRKLWELILAERRSQENALWGVSWVLVSALYRDRHGSAAGFQQCEHADAHQCGAGNLQGQWRLAPP